MVAIEHVFSKGRLVISHIRNCLSAQSTRALIMMCLGYWSKLGFVRLEDLKAGASLPDVKDEETSDDDWRRILSVKKILFKFVPLPLGTIPLSVSVQ